MPLSICCVFQSFHVCGTDWCSHYFSDFLGFYGMSQKPNGLWKLAKANTASVSSTARRPDMVCDTRKSKLCTAAVSCIFAEFKWKWPRDLGSMSFAEVWGCLYVMICHVSHLSFFSFGFCGFEVFPDNTRAASGAGSSITSFASITLRDLRAPATAATAATATTAPTTPRLCLESQQIAADRSRSQQDVSVTQCWPE